MSEEWQQACFGLENLLYFYGSRYDPTEARVGRRIWTDGPRAVRSYGPNGYGVYDMVGNAWEWADNGDTEGETRSIHGGSWVDGPRRTRCNTRLKVDPEAAAVNYGFRCVRSATATDRQQMAEQEAARVREVLEEVRRAAAAKRAVLAAEAAEKARADTKAREILEAEEAEKARADTKAREILEAEEAGCRAREAEAARVADALARQTANMVPMETGLYVDRHEVTVGEFQAFDSSYRPDEFSSESRMPATGVPYEQAVAYCRSRNKRMPTAEEWLSACFGSKWYRFSYGEQYDSSRGRTGRVWYAGADTVGVGSPNLYGATDMTGNVWEWVDGWYDQARTLRLLRGGGWTNGPEGARCRGEMWARPDAGRADVGFRCVYEAN